MRNPDGWGHDSWHYTEKIETLDELMCALHQTNWAMSAELRFCPRFAQPARVYTFQDCNYYVDAKTYEVPREVAVQAIERRLVTGVPKWGYTSDNEWRITEEGRDLAWAARKRFEEYEKTEKLKPVDCVTADEGEG